MSHDIPAQVSAFAHALAAHYPDPVVRAFSNQCSHKLTHQLRRLAALFHRNAAVLLCTPLLDHIADADSFLSCVRQELEYSRLAILCARDRERSPRSSGSPEGTGWTPSELTSSLSRHGIPALFMGHTRATEDDSARSIIVAVLAGEGTPAVAPPPADLQVIAIMSSYNEADIIGPSLDYWLDQGVRVHLLENWSTDGTDRIAATREARGVRIERFPPEGRGDHYHIAPILRRKEELAQELDADWLIHADVDEIREGPFAGGGIREALHHAGRGGFNCVNGTFLRFPPVDDSFLPGGDFRSHFRFWEPPSFPAHLLQRRIWKKTSAAVNLTDSGGHDVSFPGRRIYPFQFLLRHYPFRSSEQASRKLFADRHLDPDEYRTTGWGSHYDAFRRNPDRVRRPENLRPFSSSFYDDYLIERLSAVGFMREPDASGAGKADA
jgi:hypothetical protein